MGATSVPLAKWRQRGQVLARTAWFGLAAMALAALLASVPACIRLLGVYTQQEQFAAALAGTPALFSPSPQFEFWLDLAHNLLSFGAAAPWAVGLAAMQAGARGYLLKGAGQRTIVTS